MNFTQATYEPLELWLHTESESRLKRKGLFFSFNHCSFESASDLANIATKKHNSGKMILNCVNIDQTVDFLFKVVTPKT